MKNTCLKTWKVRHYLLAMMCGGFLISGMSVLPDPLAYQKVKILAYHDISKGRSFYTVTPEQFELQIDWLVKRGYRFITLKQWADVVRHSRPIKEKTIVVTFDDGYQNVLRYAAPVLEKYHLPATVFVITDYIGQSNTFDAVTDERQRRKLLDWNEIENLKNLGWDFQAHGHKHYPLYKLDPDLLEKELTASKKILEDKFGDPVEYYCYPYGTFDEDAVRAARRAGYLGAVSCRPGTLPENSKGDWYRLSRLQINHAMSLMDFKLRFSSFYDFACRVRDIVRRLRGHYESCGFDNPEIGIQPEALT